jgi:hypothetical protein
MHLFAAALFVLGSLTATAPTAAQAAPPANDDFASAIVIPAGGASDALDTTDAAAEVGEPNHFTAGAARHTAWYRWTAPTSQLTVVSVSSDGFDPVAAVYTGAALGSLVRVDSADDSEDPFDPASSSNAVRLSWNAVAGTTYSIAIDGYTAGEFGLTTVELRTPRATTSAMLPEEGHLTLSSPELSAETRHEAPDAAGRTMQLEFEVCTLAVVNVGCVAGGGTLVASGTSPGGLAEGTRGAWQPPAAPLGTYYWHVRGIDDLGGIGAWSPPQRFDILANVPATPELVSPTDAATVLKRPTLTARVLHPRPGSVNTVEFEVCTVAATPVQTCAAAGGSVLSSGTSASGLSPDAIGAWRGAIALPLGTAWWRARTTDEQPLTSGWSAARSIDVVASEANDDFADAITLVGSPVTTSGSNVASSVEPGEPALFSDQRSVWYSWTAPATTNATFSACGSDYDGVLGVYTGATVDALTLLESNDDGCIGYGMGGGTGGVVQISVTAGTTYRVRVGGFNASSTGTVEFGITTAPKPANDDVTAAEVLDPFNDTLTADFVGATKEVGEPDSLSGETYWVKRGVTQWFTWTAPVDMTASIARSGTTEYLDVGVFTGPDAASLAFVAGELMFTWSSPLTWSATAGTTYRIGLQAPRGVTPQTFAINTDTYVASPSSVVDGTDTNDDVDQQASTTTLRAAWSPVSDTPAGVAGYETCFSSATSCSGTVLQAWTDQGIATSQTLGGQTLGLGTTWYACVRTRDHAGNTDVRCSDGVTVEVTILPELPSLVTPDDWASGTGTQPFTARYRHDDPARTGSLELQVCGDAACTVVIEAGTSPSGIADNGTWTWTPAPLAPGSTVYWRARATDDLGGVGGWSGTRTFLVLDLGPTAPTLTAPSAWTSIGDPTPDLTATFRHPWAGRTGHLEFEVCDDWSCTTVLGTGSTAAGLTDGSSATWTVTPSLTPGSSYYWRARGVDDLATVGPWSSTRTFFLKVVPVNDAFENATTVPGVRGLTTGTNYDASWEAGETGHDGSSGQSSVWFTWTAPSDMAASIDFVVAPGSTKLAVYTGASVDALTELAHTYGYYDNDTPPAAWSAVGGTTYHIAVDANSIWSDTGSFTLELNPGLGVVLDTPLDGPTPGNDINEQTDTTQLHATWIGATDPLGLLTGYEACIQVDSEGWSDCLDPWSSVGLVTSATLADTLLIGNSYRLCIRALASDGYVSRPTCTSGVSIVAALSGNPPPPTMISPTDGSELAGLPTLEARANFNDVSDTGTIEFEVLEDGEGCWSGADVVESGSFGPGLDPGDIGTHLTTVDPPYGIGCWRARTIDDDGDAGDWTTEWRYEINTGLGGVSIAVESGAIDAGTTTMGAQVATALSVNVDPGTGGVELSVHDDSDTVAATCSCGDQLLDIPDPGWDPEPWPVGDHPGSAGLTMLDVKGDEDYRNSRWGTAPRHGASLDDLEASNWTSVGGPGNERFLGEAWGPNTYRLGYRMSMRPDQLAGTYSTNLTFTAVSTGGPS